MQKGLVFAGLGMEIIGMMWGSVVLGQVIDEYFGLNNVAMVVLMFSAFFVWVVHIVVMAKKMMVTNDK